MTDKVSFLTYELVNPTLDDGCDLARNYRVDDELKGGETMTLAFFLMDAKKEYFLPENYRFFNNTIYKRCRIMTSGSLAFDFWLPDEFVHEYDDSSYVFNRIGDIANGEYCLALMNALNDAIRDYERGSTPTDPVFDPASFVATVGKKKDSNMFKYFHPKWTAMLRHLLAGDGQNE